jgi:arabinogalactan endo-1,4-beta-galactosidase
MKHTVFSASVAAFAVSAFLVISCSIPDYPSSAADSTIKSASFTSYDSVTVSSVDTSLGSTFIRGFDASMLSAVEDTGAYYYDEDNTQKDPLAILKEHGVNWIRLRIWNNPEANTSVPAGDNNLIRTVAIAKRAKKLGLNVLLDFHYSDTWADPTHQILPASWSSITTVSGLETVVYDYTYDVLDTLNKASAVPDMVQLGNEIESGLFLTYGSSATANSISCALTSGSRYSAGGTTITVTADSTTRANCAAVLNAAAGAVRLACPSAKIMLHVSRGGNESVVEGFFDRFAVHDGSAATTAAVDFDVIGLSYYPYYSSHGTLSSLQTSVGDCVSRYGKEVVVAETSYGWTDNWSDSTNNTFGSTQESQAYVELTDTGTDTTYNSDYFTISGTTIPASTQNQTNVIRAVIRAASAAGGTGIFYWGGDWIPANGIENNWENQALFDFDGKCLPGMNVFEVTGTAD